jgi:hypothetical protein
MPSSEWLPQWWDRDIDEQGYILRAEVREAGHRIWNSVCRLAHRALGDSSDAPELMEKAIRAVSRYLDKRSIPLDSVDPAGLLVLAFYRAATRLARDRKRLQAVGGTSELANILRTPDPSDEAAARLFLEELSRKLSDKSRAVLRLRLSGYDWKQIGRMMQMNAEAARQSFWREIRKAHLSLLQPPRQGLGKSRNQ